MAAIISRQCFPCRFEGISFPLSFKVRAIKVFYFFQFQPEAAYAYRLKTAYDKLSFFTSETCFDETDRGECVTGRQLWKENFRARTLERPESA